MSLFVCFSFLHNPSVFITLYTNLELEIHPFINKRGLPFVWDEFYLFANLLLQLDAPLFPKKNYVPS